MSELSVFQDVYDIPKTRNIDRKLGVCYCIEFGDHVKIGISTNIWDRARSLYSLSVDYALTHTKRIAFTPYHANFRANEKFLHRLFGESRIGNGELFNVCFECVVDEMEKLSFLSEIEMEKKHLLRQKNGRRAKARKYIQNELDLEQIKRQERLRRYYSSLRSPKISKSILRNTLKQLFPKGN